jgi:hypothetical protein
MSDGSNDGLSALVNMDVLNNDPLLSAATQPGERIHLEVKLFFAAILFMIDDVLAWPDVRRQSRREPLVMLYIAGSAVPGLTCARHFLASCSDEW